LEASDVFSREADAIEGVGAFAHDPLIHAVIVLTDFFAMGDIDDRAWNPSSIKRSNGAAQIFADAKLPLDLANQVHAMGLLRKEGIGLGSGPGSPKWAGDQGTCVANQGVFLAAIEQ